MPSDSVSQGIQMSRISLDKCVHQINRFFRGVGLGQGVKAGSQEPLLPKPDLAGFVTSQQPFRNICHVYANTMGSTSWEQRGYRRAGRGLQKKCFLLSP